MEIRLWCWEGLRFPLGSEVRGTAQQRAALWGPCREGETEAQVGEAHTPSVWAALAPGTGPGSQSKDQVSVLPMGSAPRMAMAGHGGHSGFPGAAGPGSSRAAEESLVPSSMSWQQETRLLASHVI